MTRSLAPESPPLSKRRGVSVWSIIALLAAAAPFPVSRILDAQLSKGAQDPLGLGGAMVLLAVGTVCIALQAIAVACGVVWLVRLRRYRVRGWTPTAIAGLLIVAFWIWVAVKDRVAERGRAQQYQLATQKNESDAEAVIQLNTENDAARIRQFVHQHDGKYPASLGEAVAFNVAASADHQKIIRDVNANPTSLYYGAGLNERQASAPAAADVILLVNAPLFATPRGRYVICMSGRAKWLTQPELAAAKERSDAARKQLGVGP